MINWVYGCGCLMEIITFLDTDCNTCKLTKNRPVNYYYSVHKKIN